MSVGSVLIGLQASGRADGVTSDEFLAPLNIQPGEVEATRADGGPWAAGMVGFAVGRYSTSPASIRPPILVVTRILQDPGEIPALRGTVARALASIQGTKVVPLLSEMARRPSENDQVCFWAAMSVIQEVDGAIDDPLLLIPLQNGYVDLQVQSSLSGLAKVAEDTENALAKVAKQGKTPAVRLAASQVLAEFRQQRGQQPDDEKPHDPSGGQDAP